MKELGELIPKIDTHHNRYIRVVREICDAHADIIKHAVIVGMFLSQPDRNILIAKMEKSQALIEELLECIEALRDDMLKVGGIAKDNLLEIKTMFEKEKE